MAIVLGAVLALILLQHLAFVSEPIRFLQDPGPSPRLPAARRLIALVPADAPLAVTSQLAVHVPLRRGLYHFPGTEDAAYDPAAVERACFILGDRRRSAREAREIARRIESGEWRVVAEEADFVVLERRAP